MGKVIGVWLNNSEWGLLRQYVDEKNKELFPSELTISAIMKGLAIAFVKNKRGE